tara:strand:+ start:81374 stop:82072 length:699 start_codon:yes stop_codon:yes gene_type:complete
LFVALPIYFYGQQTDSDMVLYQSDLLLITSKKAIYKNDTIYNANVEEKKILKENNAQELVKQGIRPYVYVTYAPLSLVGNALSYKRNMADYWGGHPTAFSTITTINVATQEPYNILNIVDETSLLTAIKNDPYVKKLCGIDTLKLQQAKTFKEALNLLNNQIQYPENQFTVYSYTILGYSEVENKVALRLIRKKPRMGNFTRYLQLGLKATPTQAFKEKLQQPDVFFLGTYK